MRHEHERWGKPTAALRYELLYRLRGCCVHCGVEEWRLRARLHVHRYEAGGPYSVANTTLLCGRCHARLEGQPREVIDRRAPLRCGPCRPGWRVAA